MAGSGRLLPSGSGNSCSENGGESCDNPVIASRMTSFANRSVRRCPTGRTGPLDNAKEAMMQFWSEPRRARRLSREETRLRQGRQLSEGGSKARSPLCHEPPPAAAGRMPRGSPTSCYRIGVEYPLRPPSMLGSWDECGDSVTARCFASSLNTFPKAGTLWRNLSKSIFGMIKTSIAVHARIVALRVLLDSNAISPKYAPRSKLARSSCLPSCSRRASHSPCSMT